MCILNSRTCKDIPKQNVHSPEQNIERDANTKCVFTTAEHREIYQYRICIHNSRT